MIKLLPLLFVIYKGDVKIKHTCYNGVSTYLVKKRVYPDGNIDYYYNVICKAA